jgi:nitrite reductase/ring-hydroxylating ferredoxin subunit
MSASAKTEELDLKREIGGPGVPRQDSSVTLDAQRYTSLSFAKLEWDAIFKKTWQYACRVDQVARGGDFVVFELGLESILVLRGEDGCVRAFYNVCRHRGNRLVRNRHQGHAANIACSFHRWKWDTNGTLNEIPDRETFPGLPEDCNLHLKELLCESWAGFVFVCMDPNAQPLLQYLDPLPHKLQNYNIDRMALVRHFTVEWDCNWKVGVDAFNESYHVHTTHPQLLAVAEEYHIRFECYERHSAFIIPFGVPSRRIKDRTKLPKGLVDYANQGVGGGSTNTVVNRENRLIDPETFAGTSDDIRRAIQLEKRSTQPGSPHLPYRNLQDAELTNGYNATCFPNLQLNVYAENISLFRHRPHPTDPNRSYFDITFLAHLPEGQRPPIPEYSVSRADDTDLGLVLNQDKGNLWSVQAGMRSGSVDGLYLSEQEVRIRHFHQVVDRYIDAFRNAPSSGDA